MGLDVRPLTMAEVLRHSSTADLVHVHDARSHLIAVMLRCAPLIVSRRVAFPIGRGIASRWKYSRVDHYIAISECVRRELVAGGVPPERISVVYDGVPLVAPAVRGADIVALGSSDPAKGTDLAIEGARVAGKSIRLARDLPGDFDGAAMLVYITHSEGLGSAVLLAMSAGVPVIASRAGGLPEIIDHERTGLLVDNTSETIAAAIRRLLAEPDLGERMAAEARRSVEERFTVSHMVSATLQVYERIVK